MNTGSPTAASAELARELTRVQRLHAERAQNPILAGALDRLAAWQALRLAMTYADLAADPRYAEAIAFFQADLYGGDFSRRDSDLARVMPLMVRMLPTRVIAVVAQAMELNALSRELDSVLIARLPRADGAFTVSEYCRAYRRAGNFPLRKRQIMLIGEVGRALDHYVGKPLLRASLAMMSQPARLAGFASLQEFLERGFASFRRMHGATEFLTTIETREMALHEAIVSGSNEPFPDPLLARSTPPREAKAAPHEGDASP